jgi:hypothetical protein
MANLFNKLSTKLVAAEQKSSETGIEKKVNLLESVKDSNAIHKIQEASQKTKENLSQVDRTTVINKATSLDYDKIIKGVSAVGVFLKPARAISPSLVVLKDAANMYLQSEKEQTEKETEYVQYLGKHIDAEFLYQTISPIVTSIPYGDQIIGILDFLRKKSDEQ